MDPELRETKPFQTLNELYNSLKNLKPWPNIVKLRESAEYVYTTNEMNDVGKIVQLSKLDRDGKPRTIVCHDMKGGYLQDKFVDGSSAHDSYLFYHWSIVDTFIYFSHHMVTIPPYGWINTAHNHGVKVLGTLITEQTAGENIWENVLSSIDEIKRFADALILLAKFYNFEGWLLNIENKVKPDKIEHLLYFIQYLTAGIHNQIRDSEIIWYDSVTVDGDLEWQNELNDKNKCFFDNCDGIFLNYNWTDLGLKNSRILASHTKKVRNIYVGLDVWGRGCPGGGGFNSIEALNKIREHNFSVAIFGPAWTHEYFNGESFHKIESIFWAQLTSQMYIHVPIYDNENFETSFCRGSGLRYYQNGICNKYMDTPFYNLALQQTQISIPAMHFIFIHQNKVKIGMSHSENIVKSNEYTYETESHAMVVRDNIVNLHEKYDRDHNEIHHIDFNQKYSYDGGGCLELTSSSNNLSQSYHRLFLIHLEFDTDVQIIIIHKKKFSSNTIHTLDRNNGVPLDSPKLILINRNTEKHLTPYKINILETEWQQSFYHASDMKTIHEIGIIFAPKGRYYIGKFQLHSMPRSQLVEDG